MGKRQRTAAVLNPADFPTLPNLAIASWTAGVSRCVIKPVGMNIAIMINPLVQSVLDQKAEAKPRSSGERSQCGPVMDRSEEASFRCLMGLRLGRNEGRASPQWAKSGVSPSKRRLHVTANTVSEGRIALVSHAITQGAWLDHITDEVPRCLLPNAGVSKGYKQHVKGLRYASVAGTASYRPRLQGWQQSRSSCWHLTRAAMKGKTKSSL
jgi:hypothetical protein